MRTINIILHILKMLLRLVTYTMGFVILLGAYARLFNFLPANLKELLTCYKDVPFGTIWKTYWSSLIHFENMPGQALLFCGFTMIPLFLRLSFTGFYNAFSHEYETGDYTLVYVRTGEVVGSGHDGTGMIAEVLSRLFICLLLFYLSIIFVPILFLGDLVKAIRFFFD